MAPGWPGVLCHLPALFGPSYYQNHQKLSKQAQLQIPLTAVSPAWYSRGHQVWTPVAVVTGPPQPWILSEPILEGKVCFLSLLAVNLECLTLHLWRAQNATGSSLHGLPKLLTPWPWDQERPGQQTPYLPTTGHSLSSSFQSILGESCPTCAGL